MSWPRPDGIANAPDSRSDAAETDPGPDGPFPAGSPIDVERGFLLCGALALLGAFALGVVGGHPTGGDGIAYDRPVPPELSFEVPPPGGTATVDDREFRSLDRALSVADPGDTVVLQGRFDGRVTVDTRGVTLAGTPGSPAVINGTGEGDVVRIEAPNVTLRDLWVRNSGYDPAGNDAGIWVAGRNASVVDVRVTAVTFGVWVDGVDDVLIADSTIVGRERVRPLSDRGNGIQLWRTTDTVVRNNRITDVRDGIYYSWAEEVLARNNTMWDLRYGVHYMYSDDCRLVNNAAFDNDVGYALMVSQNLRIVNNTAVNNTGTSGHGIMVKSIDHTTIRGNDLVANEKGMYVYNSLDNRIVGNLFLENEVGVHLTAGSVRERVYGNTFVGNDRPVEAVVGQQVAWNGSDRGNYWAGATVADLDGDGISEVRHRPAGLVERIVRHNPKAAVFERSPAFDAVQLAQSTVPVVESPGVVDYHPLAFSPHDWRRYYVSDNG